LQDPKDDIILEVAVDSHTNIIVIHNKIRDFRGIDKFVIRAITPKQFLQEIK
jgi:predicted nucleic acid-binding protein